MRKAVTILSLVFSLILPSVARSQVERDLVATVNLNVRAGPSVDSTKLFVIPAGDTVKAGRCSGGWCLIWHRGSSGWAAERYLAVPGSTRPKVTPPIDAKKVFWELVEFQDKASCEAQRLYPDDIHKMAEHSTKGSWEAYGVVGRKYGMTAEEVKELVYDAVTATGIWPMPPFPCRLK